MKKITKWLFSVICMLVMLITLVPVSTSADEVKEKKVAINVKVPDDWKDPCVWAWNSDGKNAFEAWPGGQCDVRKDNDGWYYIWIPDWANHVIINANEGTVQTGELVLEGKDAWITVKSKDESEVSYTALTSGETPEYVEKFAVHAKVDDSWQNPGLWAWSAPDGTNAFEAWPGEAMKKGENGWYTAYAPVFVNSIIINANEGTVQTSDLSIDAAEIWVTVSADGNAEFSYKDPDKKEVANITIHAKAPSDWANPCLWAWSAPDGTNAFASWPGESLEEKDGWLVKEVPEWVNSIIINGSEGSVQTSDISVEAGKDVWVVVKGADDFELSYEEPKADDTQKETNDTQKDTATNTVQEEKKDAEGINPAIPVGIAVAVILIAVVVVVVVKKKK